MKVNVWLVVMENNGNYYLLGDNDGCVSAFKTQKEALDYFEIPYHRAHGISNEKSMSAVLNYISYQPSVVEMVDDETLKDYFESEKVKYVSIRGISGGFVGAVIRQDYGKEMFEKGTKPSLVR